MSGEVIAILGKKVVGRTQEFCGNFFDDGLDFVFGAESDALNQFAAKSPTGRFSERLGPVYS